MATLNWPSEQTEDGGRRSTASREEWSEIATDAVVAAWGEKHVAIGRGKLKKHEWEEVAEKVCSRLGGGKSQEKTWLQCKNKIDSVKKKYKIVLNQRIAGSLKKEWRLFDRVHELLGGFAGRVDGGTGMDSEGGDDDDDDMDGTEDVVFRQLGHSHAPTASMIGHDGQRRLVGSGMASLGQGLLGNNVGKVQMKKRKEPPSASHELAAAIKDFGTRYERVEMFRQEKMMEIERMRMNVLKDLEMQRMQMQLEIAKLHGGRQPNVPGEPPNGIPNLMQPTRQVPEGFSG